MRILVADDHRLVLDGIVRSLAAEDDIEVVGCARTGAEVLPRVRELLPDLVLLDIRMPRRNGLECLAQLRTYHPEVKVVMLTCSTDEEHITAALSGGACGYIAKSVNPADLPGILRRALNGELESARPESDADQAAHERVPGLTERETAILRCIALGRSNRSIATDLWVTEQTVKFHLTNIYRKLGAANRTEAARHAYRLGLVQTPVLEAV
jgi:two-component system NarL family response regulator